MEIEEWEKLSAAADALPRAWVRLGFGEQVRFLRQQRGVSQRHLAEFAGLHQAAVSRFESGSDGRLSTFLTLCSALGYSMTFIPTIDCDETNGLLQDQGLERADRMELGRMRRR
jgi:transcriptional regulator with XRE-family HTH domain